MHPFRRSHISAAIAWLPGINSGLSCGERPRRRPGGLPVGAAWPDLRDPRPSPRLAAPHGSRHPWPSLLPSLLPSLPPLWPEWPLPPRLPGSLGCSSSRSPARCSVSSLPCFWGLFCTSSLTLLRFRLRGTRLRAKGQSLWPPALSPWAASPGMGVVPAEPCGRLSQDRRCACQALAASTEPFGSLSRDRCRAHQALAASTEPLGSLSRDRCRARQALAASTEPLGSLSRDRRRAHQASRGAAAAVPAGPWALLGVCQAAQPGDPGAPHRPRGYWSLLRNSLPTLGDLTRLGFIFCLPLLHRVWKNQRCFQGQQTWAAAPAMALIGRGAAGCPSLLCAVAAMHSRALPGTSCETNSAKGVPKRGS